MAGGNLDTVVAWDTLQPLLLPASVCVTSSASIRAENLLHAGLCLGAQPRVTHLGHAPALTFCLEFMCSSRAFVHSFTHSLNDPPKPGCSVAGLVPASAGDTAVKSRPALGRADVLVAAGGGECSNHRSAGWRALL